MRWGTGWGMALVFTSCSLAPWSDDEGSTHLEDGFVPLFDGSTLDGFVQRGGKAAYFVEDGAIVGETRPHTDNSFLCTQREYADFKLRLEFLIDAEANSGIQIRSQSVPTYQDGRVHGYQIEIDPSDRAWTGGLYDEARRGWLCSLEQNPQARAAFKQGAWNEFRIVCDGDHIRSWLNGVAAADHHDAMTAQGFIALQVHGVGEREAPLRVRWRNLRIKELR